MAEIENKEVCHFVAEGVIMRLQHLVCLFYFYFYFIYMIQLYKEDQAVSRMLGCQAVAPPQHQANSLQNRSNCAYTMDDN